ncbi:50S ribosomal protein L35 [Nitrospira sp.]|nr:50S ribosomal protein L35 [Nitrospira sp.]
MAGRKMKTHSGASKRFKKTGTGRVLFKPSGRRHLLTSKNRSRKRRLSGTREVAPGQLQMMDRLLPN